MCNENKEWIIILWQNEKKRYNWIFIIIVEYIMRWRYRKDNGIDEKGRDGGTVGGDNKEWTIWCKEGEGWSGESLLERDSEHDWKGREEDRLDVLRISA